MCQYTPQVRASISRLLPRVINAVKKWLGDNFHRWSRLHVTIRIWNQGERFHLVHISLVHIRWSHLHIAYPIRPSFKLIIQIEKPDVQQLARGKLDTVVSTSLGEKIGVYSAHRGWCAGSQDLWKEGRLEKLLSKNLSGYTIPHHVPIFAGLQSHAADVPLR